MVKSKVRDINAKNVSSSSRGSDGGGIDEIDSLFAAKKQSTKVIQQQIVHQEALSKLERKQRKRARLEEEAEELALRGTCSSTLLSSSSSSGMDGGGGMMRKGGGDVAAPSHLHERAKKLSSLTYTRDDIERLNNNGESTTKSTTTAAASTKEAKDSWATDGLGGVFNGEGFTGRRDDGGHRVFKAHLMNKKGFGSSPDCPFDCNCCFI